MNRRPPVRSVDGLRGGQAHSDSCVAHVAIRKRLAHKFMRSHITQADQFIFAVIGLKHVNYRAEARRFTTCGERVSNLKALFDHDAGSHFQSGLA